MMKLKFKQTGFSLVTTIFILVVLVMLGGYMTTLVQIQNQSIAQGVVTTRAGFIAQSGLEWGVVKALSSDSCESVDGEILTIDHFKVSLSCEGGYRVTEDTETYSIYKITSKSEWGNFGDMDYISRQTQAIVRGEG